MNFGHGQISSLVPGSKYLYMYTCLRGSSESRPRDEKAFRPGVEPIINEHMPRILQRLC
jgi:hypothetical protein